MTPKEKLKKAISDGVDKIEKVFSPLITKTEMDIGKLEAAKLDPSKYFDMDSGEFINLYEIRDLYISTKEETIEKFLKQMDEELQKIEAIEDDPTAEEPPEIPWEKILFYLIKSALEDGVKIKIGDIEWDSAKPLGGDGSVFDDLRKGSMRAIGIDPDSELGKVVKDPFNAVKDLAENLDAEAKRSLTNIKNAADKAATDAKQAIDKAATDAKRVADKAATDARVAAEKAAQDLAREIGKYLPKLPRIKL